MESKVRFQAQLLTPELQESILKAFEVCKDIRK